MPRHAPVTREQWIEWARVWPLSWREPTDKGVAVVALHARERAAALEAVHHLRALLREAATMCPAPSNAAIIVDPRSGGGRRLGKAHRTCSCG